MQENMDECPRVWVGSLHAYNSGSLAGFWVDAVDADMTPAEWIAGLSPNDLARLPDPDPRAHEELWCFDHENFGGWVTGELSPYEAAGIARVIMDIADDNIPVGAVKAWADNQGEQVTDWVEAKDEFEEQFRGEWDDFAAFVYDFANDVYYEQIAATEQTPCNDGWPSYLTFDYEALERDLIASGDMWTADTPDHKVWVFWSH